MRMILHNEEVGEGSSAYVVEGDIILLLITKKVQDYIFYIEISYRDMISIVETMLFILIRKSQQNPDIFHTVLLNLK